MADGGGWGRAGAQFDHSTPRWLAGCQAATDLKLAPRAGTSKARPLNWQIRCYGRKMKLIRESQNA